MADKRTTRSAVEEIRKQLETFNLPGEDVALLVDYISKDPDQRAPRTINLSHQRQKAALVHLAQLMKLLETNTLLSLVDNITSDFLTILFRCMTDFPSDQNLVELHKEIEQNRHHNSMTESLLRHIYQRDLSILEVAKSQLEDAKSQLEEVNLAQAHRERCYHVFKEDLEKIQRDYEVVLEARRGLDRKFSLI